jgi:hypothetical protein
MVTKDELVIWFVLFGLPVTAFAQAIGTPQIWAPISQNAKTITGSVTFSPKELTFQNGTSLSLTFSSQMLFRPEARAKRAMADLYKITPPADPVLQNGNRLCKGKPVTYLILWKSEGAGREAERGLAPFSGPRINAGSPDDCGHFAYEAR